MYADGTREERSQVVDTGVDEDRHGETHGGHADPMVRGPLSVGMDFSFPFAQHVYGIPEHATSLSLPTTEAEECYRIMPLVHSFHTQTHLSCTVCTDP